MSEIVDGATQAAAPRAGIRSPLRQFAADYAGSKLAVAALVVFTAIVLLALFGPLFTPQNPYDLAQLNLWDSGLPPGSVGSEGQVFPLGTDDQGRDMVSAVIYGLRISLGVAISSGIIALVIGTSVGIIAGYFGGRTDTIIMRIVDMQLAFPAVLVALILLAVLGRGVDKIIFALVAVQWAYYARTVRSSAVVERQKQYIDAARCLSLGTGRIVLHHLLPNCIAPLIVLATVEMASAIALEATLSFLGVGLPVTEPSLGLLISNGYQYMLGGRYWLSFYPGIALLITIVSINLVGDQLRDVLNPRLQD